MKVLEIKWESIAVGKLRIKTQTDKIDPAEAPAEAPAIMPCYDEKLYIQQIMNVFTTETVLLLLKIHPIYVLKKKQFEVIAGARSFRIAAACLRPTHEILVGVLDKKTTNEHLRQLTYLDLAISPLIQGREGRVSGVYQSINIPDLRLKTFISPYDTSLNAFARMIGVSPPALCESSQRKPKKTHSCPVRSLHGSLRM